MSIYFILMFLWVVPYFFTSQTASSFNLKAAGQRVTNRNYAIYAGFLIFLVMALRSDTVGADTRQYAYHYDLYGSISISDYFTSQLFNLNAEQGYRLMLSMFYHLGVSWRVYLVIVSLFISFTFARFFYKYSSNIMLCFILHVCMGIFVMTMSGLRQSLAVCFTMFAFDCVREKRKVSFVIWTIVASLFHSSALVFFIVYFLSAVSKAIKKKSIAAILLMLVVALYPLRVLIAPIIGRFLPTRYETYSLLSDQYKLSPINFILVVGIMTTCLILWSFKENASTRSDLNRVLYTMGLFSIFTLILGQNSNLLSRLDFYFRSYVFLLLSNVIEDMKEPKFRFFAIIGCIVICIAAFSISTPGGILKIDQYKFFWQ